MARIIQYSNSSRCPICGKPDWCGHKEGDDGREMTICHRVIDSPLWSEVDGCDGQTYVCIGKGAESGLFMLKSLKAERDAERGYGVKDGEKYKSSSRAPKPKQYTVLDDVQPLKADMLDRVYRSFLKKLVLEDFHRDWLKKEGWSDGLIKKQNIVSMPMDDFHRFKFPKGIYNMKNPWRKGLVRDLSEEFGSLKGVPGFYRKESEEGSIWTLRAKSGVIFPLYDMQGRILALRIRMDFLDSNSGRNAGDIAVDSNGRLYFDSCEGRRYIRPLKGVYSIVEGEEQFNKSGGKYRPFTSYQIDDEAYEDGFVKNIYLDGCQSPHTFGYYSNKDDNTFCCYITEGEKKGILGNEILKAPFISLPGVNSFNLLVKMSNGSRPIDRLKELGVKVLIVCFDADKNSNEAVLKCEQKTVDLLKQEGFTVATGEWDINIGKGIDDLLLAGGKVGFSIK